MANKLEGLTPKPLNAKRRRVWICPTGTDATKRDEVKQRCRLVSLVDLEIEQADKGTGSESP